MAGYDGGLPGAGLLVYHVDESVGDDEGTVWHPKVMLVQVGGLASSHVEPLLMLLHSIYAKCGKSSAEETKYR